jgi:hypothetical protein
VAINEGRNNAINKRVKRRDAQVAMNDLDCVRDVFHIDINVWTPEASA